MESLTRDAIEKIEELIKAGQAPVIVKEGGKKYTKDILKEVDPKRYVACLSTNSLHSFIQFVQETLINNPENKGYLIQIDSHRRVAFYEPVDELMNRNLLLIASMDDVVSDYLNKFILPEEMIINLRRTATEDYDFEKVIKVISGISSKQEVSVTDDGIGQTTKLVQGSTVIGDVEIKSLITLSFKRTFLDLDAIHEDLLLRVKDGKVALFTAESNTFKRNYSMNILDKLYGCLEEYCNEHKLLII